MKKKGNQSISETRRSFLKMTAAGAAGMVIAAQVEPVLASSSAVTSPGPGNKWPGKVVVNFNKAAIGSSGADSSVISKMVDDCILKITGQTTVGAAWKAIMPAAFTANSKIGIKVPVGFTSVMACPHWSSVQAIVLGLQQMDFSGAKFSKSNIFIFDGNYGGGTMVNCGFTAANFPGILISKDNMGSGYTDGARGEQYATTLKSVDYLINVFSPRGHQSQYGGMTLGFKNHYGTYASPDSHHDTNAGQYLRDIVCTGPVYTKSVLWVCSGIYGAGENSGNPGSAAISYATYAKTIDSSATGTGPTTILMSTDPVQCEMQAVKIIRINNGGKYTSADMPSYLKASAGITVTGYTPINNIGTIADDPKNIIKIINGNSTPVLEPVSHGGTNDRIGIMAHQLRGQGNTYIEFMLPHDHAGQNADIAVYTVQGALVKKIPQKVLGVLNHVSWDEKDLRGNLVSKGTYVVRLSSGAIQASTQCAILR